MRRADLVDSVTVYPNTTGAGARKYTQTGAPKVAASGSVCPCRFFPVERSQPTAWKAAVNWDAEFTCIPGSTWNTIQDRTGTTVYIRTDSFVTHATGKYRISNIKTNRDLAGKFQSVSIFAEGPLEQ